MQRANLSASRWTWWLVAGAFVTGVVLTLGLVLAVIVAYVLLTGSDRAHNQVSCALSAALDLNFRCAYGRLLLNRYASVLVRMIDAMSTAGMPWVSKYLGLNA